MKPSRPLTIGLPVFNGEEYLSQALESLLAQTYDGFELIIADNASTDRTEEIARDFQTRDRRVQYDRVEKNIGAIANFNRVVQLSDSKYFKWAAHDDICEPTYLERCLQVLDDTPSVVWCHSQSGKIDAEGKVLRRDDPLADGWSHTSHAGLPRDDYQSQRPYRRFRGVLLGTSWCADSYGVIRTDALRKTRLLCPCFGSEKVLIGALSLRGRYEEVAETLFYQRIHHKAAGRLTSAAQQATFADESAAKLLSGTRMRLLRGHCKAVLQAPLNVLDRAQCFWAIAQYLSQFNKWPQILVDSVNGRGLRRGPRRNLLESN